VAFTFSMLGGVLWQLGMRRRDEEHAGERRPFPW
jgi:hypothetical protein